MIVLILKEKVRLFLVFSRNFWYFYFIPIIGVFVLPYLNLNFVKPSVNPLIINIFAVGFLLYIIFKNLPIVKIPGPIIFMTFNSKRINNFVKYKYAVIAIKCAIMSVIVVFLQTNLQLGLLFFLEIYKYFSIFLCGYLISWIKYNSKFKDYIFLIIIFSVLLFLLFLNQVIMITTLGTFLIICESYYLSSKMKIDWNKYYTDMKIAYLAPIYACKNDLGKAQMLAFSHNSQKILYNQTSVLYLKRENNISKILFLKAILLLLRKSKIELVYSLILVVAGIFFFKENKYIFLFLFTMGFSNLLNILKKPIIQLVEKKRKGLYLPIPENYMVKPILVISYLVVNVILFVMVLITRLTLYKVAFIFIVINAIVLITIKYFTLKINTRLRFIESIILFAIFAAIYL